MTSDGATAHGPWWEDRSTWWALFLAAWLRFLPMAMWPMQPCVRDECTYMKLAERITEGEGLTAAAAGWLWAPGYPYLMALHELITGFPAMVKGTQTVLFLLAMPLVYCMTRDNLSKAAARWVMFLLALSPTLVFFSVTLWSECFYTAVLFAALYSLGWARDGKPMRGVVPGVLVGICVLFRGVATYMLPVFAVGLLWRRWRDQRAWSGVVAMIVAAVVVVAPYASSATERWGGLIISDRTMGQMMWLGNNEFEPVTFDWGNGALTGSVFLELQDIGRERCAKSLGPVAWDDCERQGGVTWIKSHPVEFVKRVPMRVAQLMNPNSFLTRHLRWDKWQELSSGVREFLVLMVIVWSLLATVGGTIGAWARGRGWLLIITAGLVLYHTAAISLLAGLSRYRVPLDAIWLIWTAGLLAEPRLCIDALKAERWRLIGCIVTLVFLVPLVLWYLPSAFTYS